VRVESTLLALFLVALPAAAADPQRGEALFNATCRVCHGANSHPGREATRPAANRPDVIADALANVPAMRDFASLYTPGDLADIAAYLDTVFNIPQTALAVEYWHAGFDHYFVTALATEIGRLDRDEFAGWRRTGHVFRVRTNASIALHPVCRFFSAAFAPRSSHFYTAVAGECSNVKANPSWTFEGEVFHAELPASDGHCAPASAPLYRLYNNGKGGAPNHRLTPSLADRAAMIAQGWQSEGHGDLGVAMCVGFPA
jgi:cytochrome c553